MVSRRIRLARTAPRAVLACAIVLGAAAGCGIDVLGTGPPSPSALNADGGPGGGGGEDDGASDGGALPIDGGVDGPTGAPGFCATQLPYFACWDFDGIVAGGDAGFTGELNSTGVIGVTIDGANPVLQATLPSANTSRNSWVSYGISTNGQWKPGGYTLDLKFGVRQTALTYFAAGALFATSAQDHAFGVASYQYGTSLDMISPDQTPLARVYALPGTTWHAATVTFAGMPNMLQTKVVVDGVTVDDGMMNAGPPPMTGVAVRLGAFFTSTENAGATIVFDDIVVRTK